MKPNNQFIEKYKEIISEYTGVRPSEFNTKSNKRPYVVSRQLLHYFLRKEQQYLPLSEIAEITDQNHATVINSLKVIERYYFTDDDVIRNEKGFRKILDNMMVDINFETSKFNGEQNIQRTEESIAMHEKKAMEGRLAILKAQGIERRYSIYEYGMYIFLSDINTKEGMDYIEFNLLDNQISIVSSEIFFMIMPYFYDFFTEIAEGNGRLTTEILCVILENLGIQPVNVNKLELVNSNNYPIFIKNK